MNQILVIRFSGEDNFNPRLRAALAGKFDPFVTPAYPMPHGGIISVLITNLTFQEVVHTVREANCGEPVLVVDSDAALRGDTVQEMIFTTGSDESPRQLSEDGISAEIERLMEKSRTGSLSEEEANRLSILLESDPR